MADFSLLQQPSFASAALGGYQAGQAMGRQKRVDAALGGVDLSRPETIVPVLQIDPQTGAQLMQAAAGVRKQADVVRTREIAPLAVAGDKAAINELWGLDADLAGKLNDDHLKHVDQGVKVVGQAAYGLLGVPEADRSRAWDAVIDKLDDTYPELGQFKGQYSPTNLQSVLAQAGLSEKYVEATQPKYQALVPGGTLGQTNPLAGPIYSGDTAEGGDPVSNGAGASGGSSAPLAERTQYGWTPRARNGGDNSDAAVDGKIAGMSKALGMAPDAQFPPSMSDMEIARALTLSEGGSGSLADRNNNPGNLRDPSTGEYRRFGSRDEGLAAAARQVARNRARGQNSISAMVEGLPAGGAARAGLQPPRVGTTRTGAGGIQYRYKGGDAASKSSWERVG